MKKSQSLLEYIVTMVAIVLVSAGLVFNMNRVEKPIKASMSSVEVSSNDKINQWLEYKERSVVIFPSHTFTDGGFVVGRVGILKDILKLAPCDEYIVIQSKTGDTLIYHVSSIEDIKLGESIK